MQEIVIEAPEDRVESERVERGEMEGQKELGVMETEEMEADKRKERTDRGSWTKKKKRLRQRRK